MNGIGLVAIGRNESKQLQQCLSSVLGQVEKAVYVDSGSTDDSIAIAKSFGVNIIELNPSTPFTAARARNAGFQFLWQNNPKLKYVQFVDGDCEIIPGWLETAQRKLEQNSDLAIVFGRRRERYPNASIYNHLCDIEWNTPVGETHFCGGDAMIRVEAFQQVSGFNPKLIAGEEPELCVRLRQKGWKIYHLDAEMTLHDARITRWSQWWKRSFRAGYAYAQGSYLHGKSPAKHWVRETRSIWFWGLVVPVFTLILILPTHELSLLLFLTYPLLIYKTYKHYKKSGFSQLDSALYAVFCILAKFPASFGQIKFYLNQILGKSSLLIEYK